MSETDYVMFWNVKSKKHVSIPIEDLICECLLTSRGQSFIFRAFDPDDGVKLTKWASKEMFNKING